MNLKDSIVELLQRYDTVAVPGLGTFNKVQKPAELNKFRTIVRPPIQEIVLNTDIASSQKNFIISHLAYTEKIPFEKVERKIKKQVKHWNGKIKQGDSISFSPFGVLVKEKENINFRQNLTYQELLTPLVLTPIKDKKTNNSVQKKKRKPVKPPRRKTKAKNIQDNTSRTIISSLILLALVGCAVVAIIYYESPELFSRIVNKLKS